MAPRRKSRNSNVDQLTWTASLVPRLRTRRVSRAEADSAARTPSVAGQEEGRAAGPRPSAGSSAPRGSWARCRQRDVRATASPVRSGRRAARASSPAGVYLARGPIAPTFAIPSTGLRPSWTRGRVRRRTASPISGSAPSPLPPAPATARGRGGGLGCTEPVIGPISQLHKAAPLSPQGITAPAGPARLLPRAGAHLPPLPAWVLLVLASGEALTHPNAGLWDLHSPRWFPTSFPITETPCEMPLALFYR